MAADKKTPATIEVRRRSGVTCKKNKKTTWGVFPENPTPNFKP